MIIYYVFVKIVFFFMLVRTLIKFEPMQNHVLFLSLLYTAGVTFLSYAFIMSWQNPSWAPWQNQVARAFGVSPWVAWLGETLVLSYVYFSLLVRFDEGVVFWTLLLLGCVLVLF